MIGIEADLVIGIILEVIMTFKYFYFVILFTCFSIVGWCITPSHKSEIISKLEMFNYNCYLSTLNYQNKLSEVGINERFKNLKIIPLAH